MNFSLNDISYRNDICYLENVYTLKSIFVYVFPLLVTQCSIIINKILRLIFKIMLCPHGK